MGGPEMAPQLVQARGLRPLGLPGQRSGRPGGAVAPLDPRRSGQPGGAVTPLDRALEAAARARVTLILGTSDTGDRKSTRLNSSHTVNSYAVFCLKKKNSN